MGGRDKAYSIMELLVALAIITMLLALLLPALARMRSAARAATCAGGLRQWGVASTLYRNDHDHRLPREGAINSPTLPDAWYNTLPGYVNARPYHAHYHGEPLTDTQGYPNAWIWHCPTRITHDR